LDNLTLIIDRNRFQMVDRTERIIGLEPLADKWRAFGWAVREINGHDYDEIMRTLTAVPFEVGKPNCVIAHTHKGEGVSFIKDRAAWHHRVPTEEELNTALEELRGAVQ